MGQVPKFAGPENCPPRLEPDRLVLEPAPILQWPVLDQVDGHATSERALQVGLQLPETVGETRDHEVTGLRRPPAQPLDPVPARHLEDLVSTRKDEAAAG